MGIFSTAHYWPSEHPKKRGTGEESGVKAQAQAPCAALLGDASTKHLKAGGKEKVLMPENQVTGTGQIKRGLMRISERKQKMSQ